MSPPVPWCCHLQSPGPCRSSRSGPNLESRSKPRLCVASGGPDRQGIILPLRTPLPSKALAKMTQDNWVAFFCSPVEECRDWEFTFGVQLAAGPPASCRALCHIQSPGRAGKELLYPPGLLQRGSAHISGAQGLWKVCRPPSSLAASDPHGSREQGQNHSGTSGLLDLLQPWPLCP